MPYTQNWGISRNAFQSPLNNDEVNTDPNADEDIIEQNNDKVSTDYSNITSLLPGKVKNPDIGYGEGKTPPSFSQSTERSGNWFSNLWDDAVTALKNPTRIMSTIKDNRSDSLYKIQQDQDARKELERRESEGTFFNEYDKANLKSLDDRYSQSDEIDAAVGFIPHVAIAKGVGLTGQGLGRNDASLVGEGAMNLVAGGVLGKLGQGSKVVKNLPINPQHAEHAADLMKFDKYMTRGKASNALIKGANRAKSFIGL